MNDPVNLPPNNLSPNNLSGNNAPPDNLLPGNCPQCEKELQSQWVVCPYCGLRLKPADDLLKRSLMWIGVLLTFVLAQTLIAQQGSELAGAFGVIVGLPLAYVFGKAVVFRVRGVPLTWNQLSRTSVRAFFTAFILLFVLPLVIGIAALILLLMACSAGFGR